MTFREFTGKNVEEAIRTAMKEFEADLSDLDIEILAQGNRVRVAVNGTQVVDWRDPEPQRIKEGPIGLQLHSNNVAQEVRFKGLKLETFPKEDKLLTVK